MTRRLEKHIANVFVKTRVLLPKCGRMVYIYPEKNLRTYPETIRGTEEWDDTYKIRTVVEREINHIKDNLCLAGRRTQNEKTLHADLILAGITQLITVVLADKINHHEYIRSLKASHSIGLTNLIKPMAYLSVPKISRHLIFFCIYHLHLLWITALIFQFLSFAIT